MSFFGGRRDATEGASLRGGQAVAAGFPAAVPAWADHGNSRSHGNGECTRRTVMSMCLAAAATVGSLTTAIAAAQPRNDTHRTLIAAACCLLAATTAATQPSDCDHKHRALIAAGCWEQVGTVAETGGQPTPAEQVANIHRANLLGREMLCFASNSRFVRRLKHLSRVPLKSVD